MVSDLKAFAHKGCKIVAAKKVFYRFLLIFSFHLNVFLHILPGVQCPNFLDFQNPWGKVMERSGHVCYFHKVTMSELYKK